MATYLWSTLTNGQVIDPFDPSADALRFDVAALFAAGITVDGVSVPGSTRFSDGAKTVTVHVNLYAITTSNVRFDDGSFLIAGDNTVSTTTDNFPHTLIGGSGRDHLIGGASGDTLDGGAGADRMAGGAGDDTYLVNVAGDAVVENAAEGHDLVIASANFVLPANVEDLRLDFGTAPLSGTGNDLDNIIEGNDGDNTLIGGGGLDKLSGRSGDDNLQGGAADDTLIGGPGADHLDGGPGFDLIRYDYFNSPGVVVNLVNPSQNTGEAAGDTFVSIERIVGSRGDDTLIGDSGPNRLYALTGRDVLYGGAGDDILETQDAQDVLHGGPGADVLRSLASGLTLGFVYASYSTATAGVAADLLNPTLNTGDAAGDTYTHINGLVGSNFADALIGDAQINDIAGKDGADFVDGGGGDDNLQGGNGDDILQGNTGDDVLAGDGGADRLDGGAGTDTARYDKAPAGVFVDLVNPSHNTGEAAGDTYLSIEWVKGSRFGDTFIGNDNPNTFFGEGGDDESQYGAGDDMFAGGGGNDIFYGFGGSDTAFGGAGDDRFISGAGNDFFEGGPGADVFFAGPGMDYARYRDSASGIVVDLEHPEATAGDAAGDTFNQVEGVVGTRFDDSIYGNDYRNDFVGGDGNDHLEGRANPDNLNGGNGDDVLEGGTGGDRLVGGAGNDTFILRMRDAAGDQLIDFDGNGPGAGDQLQFEGYGAGTLTQVSATVWRVSINNSFFFEDFIVANGASIDASDYTFI